jgi:hypothetical protein
MRIWLSLKAANSSVHSRRYLTNAGVAFPRSNWDFAQACLILAVSISRRRCWRGCKGMADVYAMRSPSRDVANNSGNQAALNHPWSINDRISSKQKLRAEFWTEMSYVLGADN